MTRSISARALLGVLLLSGCGPKLGEVPFLCNKGVPECPDGYECKGGVCVKEGTCPETVPACKLPDCGNGTCDSGETVANCPADCKAPATCGNGSCDQGETSANCPADCKTTQPVCGDGKCEGTETAQTCPADCYIATCGNGSCDLGETTQNCPADCKPVCGDGKCEGGETTTTCPADCKSSLCGNGVCDPGESGTNCPADCSGCTANASQCDGTDKLKFCENGAWKTDTCENLCKAGAYDYSAGCEYSAASAKYVCSCGKYVGFGGVCDDKLKCDPTLFCGVFGTTSTKGFCTKYCTNPNGKCTGAPSGTSATCTLQVSGKDACGFDCEYSNCPTGLKCDWLSALCKP